MEKTFLIIDDDVSIRKMLELIIKQNNLGKVVAELEDGAKAVEEILFYNTDIILIDLLLPVMDGVKIVKKVKEQGYKGKIIMVSQVLDQELITKAYENGIVFFINKPINNIETIKIIKVVAEHIDLERSLSLIKNAVQGYTEEKLIVSDNQWKEKLNEIFTDIGINGVAGSNELRQVIEKIIQLKKRNSTVNYQLYDLYEEIVKENGVEQAILNNQKSFEQRIRRAIQKALSNLSERGCEDYADDIFMEYSKLLFDFKQVRQEMRYIKNSNEEPGKINTKKFMEGIISKMQR